MVTVGFEPTKHNAHDLKSGPVDQAWVRYLDYDEMILFHSELIKSANLLLQLGSNQRPIG